MKNKLIALVFCGLFMGCQPAIQKMNSDQAIYESQACIEEQSQKYMLYYKSSDLALIDGIIECSPKFEEIASRYSLTDEEKKILREYSSRERAKQTSKAKKDQESTPRSVNAQDKHNMQYFSLKREAIGRELKEYPAQYAEKAPIFQKEYDAFMACSAGAKPLSPEARKNYIAKCAYDKMPHYLWANPAIDGEDPGISKRADYLPARLMILIDYAQLKLMETN